MLLQSLLSLQYWGWYAVFPQRRTLHRAMEHAIAFPSLFGRRTITRVICALGRHQQDWSSDYKLYSRSTWDEAELFNPIYEHYVKQFEQGPVVVALDDTRISKSGKKIPGTSWHRDPLSPPFHVNFLYGQRFITTSLIFPHHQCGDHSPRAIPIHFQEARAVKKPGKKATEDQKKVYRTEIKQHNLSTQAFKLMKKIRSKLDQAGARHRLLIFAVDGSYCNRTIFRVKQDRTVVVARCRKDARLCYPAPPGQRRKYDQNTFTPEHIRTDDTIAWQRVSVWLGGDRRRIRYKECRGVLWRRGAGLRALRLIVIAPTPYKRSPHSRTCYRQPAYLLSTDTTSSTKMLIQAYNDRWQIEVNHREFKSILGVGQAQVWSEKSVPRQPCFMVASYSLMHLAALKSFGPGRTTEYAKLPKWRRNAKRPSLLDILTLLRKEIDETQISGLANIPRARNLYAHADT